MSTSEQLVREKKTGPYNMPIRVKIVAADTAITYGEGKQYKTAAIADTTTAMRMVCFDPQKFSYITEGRGLVLRNVILKTNEIVITKQSKLYYTNPPEVSDSISEEGVVLIFPPAPECIPISEAKKSPKKVRLSVKGKVINEGIATTVTSKSNTEIKIKTITLADSQDEIKVALWREKSILEVHPGQYIKITHVVVDDYKSETNLNTTQFSQIEVTEAQDEEVEITVLGYDACADQDTLEVLTQNKGTYTVSTTLFENIKNQLPKTMIVKINGKIISDIISS